MKRGATIRRAWLAGVAGLLALPGGAGAAGKPDLVVTAAKSPPAEAHIGEDLPVELTIQNKGRRTARASKAGLGLATTPSVTSPPEIELQTLDTPSIKPRKKKTVRGAVPIPEDQGPAGPFHLLTCADRTNVVKESKESNNCKASTGQTRLKFAPTTYELIDAEYETGQITLGQALLFKLFGEADDPRLPDRFGDPPDEVFDDSEVAKQAGASFASLPAADQAAIEPFFRPPIYEGAVFPGQGAPARRSALVRRGQAAPMCAAGGEAPELAQGWAALETTHFRIHYYTQKPYEFAPDPSRSLEVAQAVAAAAENVYAKETPIFGFPMDDGAEPCNGGDARIDVYAAKMRGFKVAQTLPYLPGAENRPGWIFLDLDRVGGSQEVRDVFAHEFAHLLQLRHDYLVDAISAEGKLLNLEYGWLEEATATWAIDYVYPDDDYEWRFADAYFGEQAWNDPMGEANVRGELNGYRDYLFFLYLTKTDNSTAAITQLFENAESMKSVSALNQALGGQFPKRFREFALHTLNRDDYDQFSEWDGLSNQLDIDGVSDGEGGISLSLGGLPSRELKLPFTDSYQLDATDYRVVEDREFSYMPVDLPDANVRKIEFENYGWRPNSEPTAGARIIAWYKLANGTTHTQDWTSGATKEFCRDDPSENLIKLVLFYVNGEPGEFLAGDFVARPEYEKGRVKLKDACDPVPYDVTFSGTSRRFDAQNGSMDATTNFGGTMRLDIYDGPGSGFSDAWEIVDGALNVSSYGGKFGQCTGTAAPETFDLPATNSDNAPVMARQGGAYSVNAPWVIYAPQQTITLNLSGGDQCKTVEWPIHAAGQWITRTPTPLRPQPNGNLQATVHLTEDPEWTHDLTFTLVPDWE
jgi:hypothetical protein